MDVERARVEVEFGVVEGTSWLAMLGKRWSIRGVASIALAVVALQSSPREKLLYAYLAAVGGFDVPGKPADLDAVVSAGVGCVVRRVVAGVVGVKGNC